MSITHKPKSGSLLTGTEYEASDAHSVDTGLTFPDQGSTPATPASGHSTIYTKSDGLYVVDDAGTETGPFGGGSVATDSIWTTSGMVAVATGTATATEQWPPGYEFVYTEVTSDTNITATSEATANTVVTAGSAFTGDGSTTIYVEWYFPSLAPTNSTAVNLLLYLFDGSSSLGIISQTTYAGVREGVASGRRKLTPSATTHTYSIRGSVGSGTGVVRANAGGSTTLMPGYIRVYKA